MIAITLLLISLGVESGIILKNKEGFEVANGNSSIQFDVYFDLHCPNSADFYGNLQNILTTKVNDKPIAD